MINWNRFMRRKPSKSCICKILDRPEEQSQREWLKDSMCMYHWMQTDYYKDKIKLEEWRKQNDSIRKN